MLRILWLPFTRSSSDFFRLQVQDQSTAANVPALLSSKPVAPRDFPAKTDV